MTIVQRAPEIPGRNRAVRPPLLTMFHQFFWRRQFPSAKSFGEAFTYSIIIDRPDIRPAKIEEKQHLDSPATDAAHLRKTGDDRRRSFGEARVLVALFRRASSRRDLLLPQFSNAKDQQREASHPGWRELLRGRAICFWDKARGHGPRWLLPPFRSAADRRSIPQARRTRESKQLGRCRTAAIA